MSVRQTFWDSVDWLDALVRNRFFWGGMGILFVIGLGVYIIVDGIIMPSYTRHDVSLRVPNVEKLAYKKAEKRLQENDLQVRRQVGRYNPNVDTGVVVDQTPLPKSKVKPGRRVYLTVNAGQIPMVKIPDLTGMSVREAKNRVSSLGLVVGAVQQDPIPAPYPNTITKQRPSPGDSLQEGKTVNLWYSTGLGETEVEVPNLVGQNVEVARRFLLQRELRSVIVDTAATSSEETASQEGPPGAEETKQDLFVLRQGRAPGTSVRAGTEIRLFTTTDSEEAEDLREEAADSTATEPDRGSGN